MSTQPTAKARSLAEVAQALADIEDREQPGRTFDLLARMLDRTDRQLQQMTGISRQTINAKRTGKSPVRLEDLVPLADAVDVEVDVLLLEPSRAAVWLAQNRADHFDQRETSVLRSKGQQSRCMKPTAGPLLLEHGNVTVPGPSYPVRWGNPISVN